MKSTPIFKILSIAVLAAVVLLLGVEAYRYFHQPYATSVTYMGQVSDSIEVTGWVIRREQTLPAVSGTVLRQVEEGEKVRAGETVAVSYAGKSALDTVTELKNAELKLEQLEFARDSFLDSDAALKVDSTVSDSLVALHAATADGDYSAASDELSAVKTAVLKRSYSYTSAEEIEAEIAATQDSIQSMRNSLSGAVAVKAPVGGIYSSSCDGYEAVLTPDMLENLTPSGLEGFTAASTDGCDGKLITSSTWYYAVTLQEETAARLAEGQEVTLRFSKGLEQETPAYVTSISAAEDGQVAVVLTVTRYIAQVTMLRHQQGEILLQTYEGLHIDSGGLRMLADGTTGVYCRVGAYAVFKPVEVCYRGEGYYLVEAAADAQGEAILRVGDAVISTAETLTDGMLLPDT